MGVFKNPHFVMRNPTLAILSEAKGVLVAGRNKQILQPPRPKNDNSLQVC